MARRSSYLLGKFGLSRQHLLLSSSGRCRAGLLLLMVLGVSALSAPGALASQAGWVAAGSFFLPGVGQLTNQQPGKAAAHFSFFLAATGTASHYIKQDDYIEFAQRFDADEEISYTNRTTERAEVAGRALTASMFYSSYDAYLERRRMLGNSGYNTPVADESLPQLALAPFQRKYFTRWTTFVPLAFAASTLTLGADDSWVTSREDGFSRGEAAAYQLPKHGAVAIGEEAFFRGVLNNSFSHQWGRLWGLGASSLAFGVVHTGDGLSADSAVATAFGTYLGWLHQRNGYRLGEGVAIHFWWNVLISLAALRHDPADRTAQAAISVPF